MSKFEDIESFFDETKYYEFYEDSSSFCTPTSLKEMEVLF